MIIQYLWRFFKFNISTDKGVWAAYRTIILQVQEVKELMMLKIFKKFFQGVLVWINWVIAGRNKRLQA